jgi:periplasmic mercuric ion binding protein
MKNLKSISLFTLLLLFCGGISLCAQTAEKTATIKIKTSAECDMCKQKLEKEVGLMKGVKKAELDLATQVLTVEYNPKKTNPDKIRTVITNAGYDADDKKANNRAQSKLPACCKPGADSMQKHFRKED